MARANRIQTVTLAPEDLQRARRDHLAQLTTQHAALRSGASALALARGQWQAGHYPAALRGFAEAAELEPGNPATHVSLVRAASMLGLRQDEDAWLQRARLRHPASPELLLHAALRKVPADPPAAAGLLQTQADNPILAAYLRAIECITSGAAQAGPAPWDDPEINAQWDSLQWALEHAGAGRIHGLPLDVLATALDAWDQQGLALECGVYFGRSLRIIAKASPGMVHGFDSFQGLPEAWKANEPAGAYSTAGLTPEELPHNVQLHRGWFSNTLPAFLATTPGELGFLHVDCDLYSSTRTVLEAVADRIRPGTVIVFDDLLGYPGYEQHELRAWREFSSAAGLSFEVLACCLMGREVALRIR